MNCFVTISNRFDLFWPIKPEPHPSIILEGQFRLVCLWSDTTSVVRNVVVGPAVGSSSSCANCELCQSLP